MEAIINVALGGQTLNIHFIIREKRKEVLFLDMEEKK